MTDKTPPPFGTQFSESMAMARYTDGAFSSPRMVPVEPLQLHPAAHVLHYGSACFEGLKAFRMPSGEARIFRLDRHIERMSQSAAILCLPVPSPADIEQMIRQVVEASHALIPEPPGALYLRPTLIGTEANIGAAGVPSKEALFYVLGAPVGDYFAGAGRALKILVEDVEMRSTPGFGQAKTGGNYAGALRHVMRAKHEHAVDQVLFCPGGDVQETGASNFFLLDDKRVLTKPLDASFLHGVTRDSVLKLAAHLGYEIIERDIRVPEMLEFVKTGEAALSGTAAVLAGVGSLVYQGQTLQVGNGTVGPNTKRLREALTAIQFGQAEDVFGWLS